MNKVILAIAGIAVLLATASPDAQSRGVVSGWSSSPTSAGSGSASVSGYSTMGATGTSSSHSSSIASAFKGAGSVSGYSLPTTANGVSSSSMVVYSSPLHLNPNGTLSHGVAPGSLSSNGNLGLLSMTPSQTAIASGSPGVGNSDASVYYAQLASFGQGSSLMQASSGQGNNPITSSLPSSAGGLLGRIASYLANASGATTGMPSSSAGIPSSSITAQTSKAGLVPNKSCAGGIGASAHACN